MNDPKGTAPGLAPKAQVKPKIISLGCKNPNTKCDSMEAVEINVETAPHVGQRVYRCAKCGHTTSIAVGGAIVL